MRPHLGCAAAEMAHWRAGIARDHAKCAAPLQLGHIVTTTSAEPWRSLSAPRLGAKKAGRRPAAPAFPPLLCQHPHWQSVFRRSDGRLLLGLGLGDAWLATRGN